MNKMTENQSSNPHVKNKHITRVQSNMLLLKYYMNKMTQTRAQIHTLKIAIKPEIRTTCFF